jgi:hypothetical protein
VAFFGCGNYDEAKAPSICVEGTGHGVGTHGLMHTFQSDRAMSCPVGALATPNGLIQNHRRTTLGQAQKDGAAAVTDTFPESTCSEACIESQLSAYHEKQCKMYKEQPIKAVATCHPDESRISTARQAVINRGSSVGGSGT